jgi:nucleoside-diphosphate-sugar epimerase
VQEDPLLSVPPTGVALVTGGTGFIGRHLCRRLAGLGLTVHSASRREQSGDSPIRHWQVDLVDFAAVRRCVQEIRPDYIFHLAGHVMGAPDIKHIIPTFQGNLQSTVNLLTAVAESGCRRFVMNGSFMEPADSLGNPTPTSPYAAAKWASTAYGRMFSVLYKVPITTARVAMVYGPGQQDESKLVPYVIKSLLKGEPPQITSGTRLVDWVYVEDVVEGFVRLAVAPRAEGLTVDIASGSLIATADLVTLICEIVGSGIRPQIGVLPDRPFEPTGIANIAVSRNLLGWSPTVPLATGLRRTVDSYR